MSSKNCYINPLTNRAIKTSGVTYKKLMEKEKKTTTIQAAIKSKKAQSELNEKKDAVNKLKAVVKRSTTKKPDPPKKTETLKKIGFEDLPNDLKDKITEKVYENMTDKELLKYLKERMNKLKMTYPGYTKFNRKLLIEAIKDTFDFQKKNNIKPITDDDFKDEYKNKKRNEMIDEISKKLATIGAKQPGLKKFTNKDLYYLLYEGGIEKKIEKLKNKKTYTKKKLTIFDIIQIPPESP